MMKKMSAAGEEQARWIVPGQVRWLPGDRVATPGTLRAPVVLTALVVLFAGGCAERTYHPAQDQGQDVSPADLDRRDLAAPAGDQGDAGGCIKEDRGAQDLFVPREQGVIADAARDAVGADGDGPAVNDVGGGSGDAGDADMAGGAPDMSPEASVGDVGFGEGADLGASGCPPEMVEQGTFCIDRYEASHADATGTSMGVSAVAASRAGVIPWFPVTLAGARAACVAAGKRLCRKSEWMTACQGPGTSVYSYGNVYDPLACNGIDTFCNCASAACASLTTCPYAHCFNSPSPSESGGPCGASFRVMPTGSFPSCVNAHGVYDINGNVWEIVESSDGLEHFRGGAYNCGDSEMLHRCDYDATWNPSAKGFRCCADLNPS